MILAPNEFDASQYQFYGGGTFTRFENDGIGALPTQTVDSWSKGFFALPTVVQEFAFFDFDGTAFDSLIFPETLELSDFEIAEFSFVTQTVGAGGIGEFVADFIDVERVRYEFTSLTKVGDVAPVPLPAGASLLFVGLGVLGGVRHRQRIA
ncbi:MAG: VPLPA-CTERM sorting domain-containing protein [Pseudomonadota bacterium]